MGLISRALAQRAFSRASRPADYNSARWSSKILASLWPTAWRTGMVTLGIYATLIVGTLICTAYLGVKTTASFGLSMQLALAAVSVAGLCHSENSAHCSVACTRPLIEISQIVFSRVRWFWIVYICLAMVAMLFGQRILHDLLHSRTFLLPTPVLIALFVVIGLEGHHGIFREVALTAHENPFAMPVVVSGILIVCLAWVLVQWIGIWGLVVAPGIVQICFNNWWTVAVGFRSFGASWRDYLFGLFRFRPEGEFRAA